jgi:hypothetical protein
MTVSYSNLLHNKSRGSALGLYAHVEFQGLRGYLDLSFPGL